MTHSASRPTTPSPTTTTEPYGYSGVIPLTTDAAGRIIVNRPALMFASQPYFMSQLCDEAGNKLAVAEHHEEWCGLLSNPLVCMLAPRDHGKRLDVGTPIATPSGWTTMGELRAGDALFDENGRVCHVTQAHPVELGDSYRVTFDDGSTVLADAEHLWKTWTAADRNPRRGTSSGPAVRTTAEIRATLMAGREHNHSIPVAMPLDLPEADLPVDPYVLGAWLGDGTTGEAVMTIHEPELVDQIEASGCALRRRRSPVTFLMEGHTQRLRQAGVLDRKHVPMAYLRSAIDQRRALLAGLMDTDGHAAADGTVEFTSTIEQLALDVFELAVSLGFKPRTYAGRATLHGRDIGPKWRVCWTPRVDVFRLMRKRALLRPQRAQANRTAHRYVVAVDKIDNVPMRCITVDSPSHLYLAGRQMIATHNTWTVLSYLLWRAWKHNRHPITGELLPDMPEGRLEVLYFSDTIQQAGERFETFRGLLSAEGNRDIFGDILPDFRRGKVATIRSVWAQRRVRLKNGFTAVARGYRTSTRGVHPTIVVLDDVLNDTNTLTKYQRDKTWRYLMATIMPMNAKQVIVIGTAFHYDDLLHRLKPDKRKAPLVVNGRKTYFVWRKYRAVNWDTGDVLWPEQHSIEDLEGRRDADPLLFAREFQNDPRDDASSIFPAHLTKPAIDAGAAEPFAAPVMKVEDFWALPPELRPPPYVKDQYEFTVLSADMALSGEVGADYCAIEVGSYDVRTQKRRLIWAMRERGLDFHQQVQALRMACWLFKIDLGCMEHNSFQRWVRAETLKYPETAGRIVGHNTGPERQTLQEGVPSLVIGLAQRLWTIYSGDKAALRFASIWQSEMNAFGWKDDKLQGVGEHDDTVMAFWLLERAVRLINTLLQAGPEEQFVGLADVGIDRVRVAGWDQPFAYGR